MQLRTGALTACLLFVAVFVLGLLVLPRPKPTLSLKHSSSHSRHELSFNGTRSAQ